MFAVVECVHKSVSHHFTRIVVQPLLSFEALCKKEKRDISIRPFVPVGHKSQKPNGLIYLKPENKNIWIRENIFTHPGVKTNTRKVLHDFLHGVCPLNDSSDSVICGDGDFCNQSLSVW